MTLPPHTRRFGAVFRVGRILAQPDGMRFDGVESLRADTHRAWSIARWARFS